MDELLGIGKSIVMTIVKLYLVIVLFTLIVFGPGEAAGFVKWSVGLGKDAGESGKVFIEEVKK